LAEYGIAAEGIANFVSKTKTWDRQRVNGLQKLFTSSRLGDRDLLVMKAEGYLTDDNDVSIRFIPYVWLRADSVQLNPALIEQEKP
jgi:hypothetical protein